MTRTTSLTTTAEPRVYVGTYAKYASGNLAGDWLTLSDYTDRGNFMAAARALHADEADPELMFQDSVGFPKTYYSESEIHPGLWDWMALDADDRELVAVYTDALSYDAWNDPPDIDAIRDQFAGRHASKTLWAEAFLEDCGMLAELPKWAKFYIDFEAYATDAELGGDMVFIRHQGDIWAFHNH
jgi:antirestriction protein